MSSDSVSSQASTVCQPELIQALHTLSAALDSDGLLRALAEAALELGSASVVEIALAVAGDGQLASEFALHTDGAHRPLFPDIGRAQLTQAAMQKAKPQLGFLADFDGEGSRRHVLVYPINRSPASNDTDALPLGVVALGYADAPSPTPGLLHSLDLLTARFVFRLHQLLSDRVSAQHKARIDLVSEISAMVVQDGSGELLFNTAIRRIEEVFDLDTVALYAGKPLTLRLLSGGRATRLGTPVPEEVISSIARNGDAAVVHDLPQAWGGTLPSWVSTSAKSEVVIPLTYRNRRIGVLDLYCPYSRIFDETDLQVLMTLGRQLALLIVQERWEEQDAASSHRHASHSPTVKNRRTQNGGGEDGAQDSQQLQVAYDRLQEFAELKDQILQNISHELRTPLTLIKGYLELMMEGQMGELRPEQRQSLQLIVRKADDVTRIVEEIVALSPLNRLSMAYQRIPVSELIAELALVFVQRTQGTGINWDFQPIDDDLYLSGDLVQIRQVFYNILDNSVKFSPQGGRIQVRTIPEQAHVHLVFQDEGIGIPKPRLTQIFETFYQVDGTSTRRFGGLGLGLAVVARLVKAHNGKVWAESELGKGSTFHVLLPKYISPNQVFQPGVG